MINSEFQRLESMPEEPMQIVCCLVFDGENKLLLLNRHREDFGGGLYGPPGGKHEAGEDYIMTARRETKEETGLTVSHLEYLGLHELCMPHGAVHMRTYKGIVPTGSEVVLNPKEHESYRWFSLEDILPTKNIIWGLPTSLYDFGFIDWLSEDKTLSDGSTATLLSFA